VREVEEDEIFKVHFDTILPGTVVFAHCLPLLVVFADDVLLLLLQGEMGCCLKEKGIIQL